MEYISSDTNVWLDFAIINRLDVPFKLPYTYIMNEDAINNELLSPKEIKQNLINLGLEAVELSEEEFYLAEEYNMKYQKTSLYDCVALAIAKVRGITLMSGDGPLRKAHKRVFKLPTPYSHISLSYPLYFPRNSLGVIPI